MATTITNPQISTFKRFKMQYFAAAAGVALAVSAVVGGLALRDDAPASTPSGVAPTSVGKVGAGSFPLVQEMSHPQIASAVPAAEVRTTEIDNGTYPLVQEMSHPQIAAAVSAAEVTTTKIDNGTYPLVQEMSHPQIAAPVSAAEPTATEFDNGLYPLVQEMSHPR